MRRILLIITFVFSLICATNAQKERQTVYLWDISLSMWGYNNSPNIQSDTREALIKAIENSPSTTEVIVMPFQDKLIDRWHSDGTKENNALLIKKIKAIKKKDLSVTNTNLAKSLEGLIPNINKDIPTRIYTLTDGMNHNLKGNDIENLLKKFEVIAREKKAYIYYYAKNKAGIPKEFIKYDKEFNSFEITDNLSPKMSKIESVQVKSSSKDSIALSFEELSMFATPINIELSTGTSIKNINYIASNKQLNISSEDLKDLITKDNKIDIHVKTVVFENGEEKTLDKKIVYNIPTEEAKNETDLGFSWWWLLIPIVIAFAYIVFRTLLKSDDEQDDKHITNPSRTGRFLNTKLGKPFKGFHKSVLHRKMKMRKGN